MCYLLACAWPFSWIGHRWLKEDVAAAARSSPVPPADTVAVWYRTRGTQPTAGSRPRRRRGVQYYSSASISIARTDILNVSRRRLPTLPMLRSSRSGTLRVHGLEEQQ
ncbi:hypothetical protein ZWY2020_014125 [Hordeum vulgare]|nr:hypothetical protein ZWY2020_014125 [Hordeum vulgare]